MYIILKILFLSGQLDEQLENFDTDHLEPIG